MPSVILPSVGTNVQQWMLIRMQQYPATDQTGAARDVTDKSNIVWNCLIDWQAQILLDKGAYGWGEVRRAWTLNLIEAQQTTIGAINADTRTQSVVIDRIAMDDTPTIAQRVAIGNFLQNRLGYTLAEVTTFGLNKPLRQIFQFFNNGICNRIYDDVLKTITFDGANLIGFHHTIDDTIDEFNWMKTKYA